MERTQRTNRPTNGNRNRNRNRNRRRNRKNTKLAPVIVVIVLILLVLLITVGTKIIQKYIPSKEHQDMTEYYHLQADDDISLVVNHEVLETPGKYIDGEVYVDYETVHDRFNDRFYWDANENVLLYTLPDNLVTVAAGSNTYQVGKENQSADYTIVRNDSNTMYLALDFVEQYTNITHEVYEDPNRTVINTVWGDVDTAPAKKATQLRLKGGIKSPIVKDLEKGETLTILDAGDSWTKAMTEDGVIGYLKNKFVGKVTTETLNNDFTEPEFTHISKDFTIEMAWHQVTTKDANSTIATVLQNTKGINVIAPTWFYLNDNNGNIANLASLDYVNYCHQNNIEVWGLVSNLENKEVDTAAVLTHTSTRQYLVNQIISAAIQYDLDGINLDFESLNSEAVGDSYIQFIRELSLKCANNGVVLSVDNYVPSAYTAFYDREEQANFADYVVIMGYDEHYAGSDEGSVASIGFVTNGVADTLKEVPANQIILGCPFYTRIWAETPKADDEEDTTAAAAEDYVPYDLTSEAVGMDTVQKRLELNGATPTWSEEDGQNYAEYVNDGVTYKVWIEDAASLEKKLEVMKSNKLAGISFWKLGFETDSIWDTIIKYTNN